MLSLESVSKFLKLF